MALHQHVYIYIYILSKRDIEHNWTPEKSAVIGLIMEQERSKSAAVPISTEAVPHQGSTMVETDDATHAIFAKWQEQGLHVMLSCERPENILLGVTEPHCKPADIRACYANRTDNYVPVLLRRPMGSSG